MNGSATIRADFFGYVALGQPELAGRTGVAGCVHFRREERHLRRDVGGGHAGGCGGRKATFGGSWRVGLSEIPASSGLTEAIRDVLSWHATQVPYAEAVQRIHRRWDENRAHDWCHTLSNAQIVAMGLLYGEGDYEKAITRGGVPLLRHGLQRCDGRVHHGDDVGCRGVALEK